MSSDFDYCKEGRLSWRLRMAVTAYFRKTVRIDDRRHHSGQVFMPLNHFHGISIYLNVDTAPQGIAAVCATIVCRYS